MGDKPTSSHGKFERREVFKDLAFSGAISFQVEAEAMNVSISINEKGSDVPAGTVTQRIPLSAFFDGEIGFADERDHLPPRLKGLELMREFRQGVTDNFLLNLHSVLTEEALIHAADCISMVLMDTGLETIDKQEIVQAHLKRTEDRLRRWLKVARGQLSKWDKAELQRALRIVLDRIPRNAAHDLNAAAEGLKLLHPDKAPASGDSLRMLLSSLEINWKTEKTAALKRKVKTPQPFGKS